MAYVFLAYGMHSCLNAVAGAAGTPGCVLIRALEPIHGAAAMATRRRLAAGSVGLTNGPAKLTQALAITLAANGADLTRGRLTIVPPPRRERFTVAIGPRVGITRATDWPLRFAIHGSRYVSRPRPPEPR
jgi:DNA-3-methyladenine glycosylase